MYPIPKPSAATGPKPNSRSAGFPQFEVERMDRFKMCHPLSVKMAGSGGFSRLLLPLETVLVGDVGLSSSSKPLATAYSRSRSRCMRQ